MGRHSYVQLLRTLPGKAIHSLGRTLRMVPHGLAGPDELEIVKQRVRSFAALEVDGLVVDSRRTRQSR
jgi:hypothetical protein